MTGRAGAPSPSFWLVLSAAFLAAPESVHPQAMEEFLGESAGRGSVVLDAPLVDFDGPYVLVHLETNRVYIFEGTVRYGLRRRARARVSGSPEAGRSGPYDAPGTVQGAEKEKDPVWIAPDWYYVEKGLRVPSPDSPSRRIPGAMGTTAIYLGDGIAIHGTFSPGLIMNPDPDSRRVSHGCIRLTNEAARDLFHLVRVGTPVLIY